MYISFFLAKNNMKKKKSDVAVVTLLIILSTMLLYISTSVLGNVMKLLITQRMPVTLRIIRILPVIKEQS